MTEAQDPNRTGVILRITCDGKITELDFRRFMLSEAVALQDATGMDVDGIATLALRKDFRTVGSLLWLAELRALAAAEQITIPQAVVRLPHDEFDINIMGLAVEVVGGPKPPAPTRTRKTRTPPAASAKAVTRTRAKGAATSASSRKS